MRRYPKAFLLPALLVLFILLSSAPLTAFSGSAEEEHGTSHDSASTGLIGKIINFLVLFGGLGFLLRKPIRNYLESYGNDIRNSMDDAEKTRKAAEKELNKVRKRLKEMVEEAENIKKSAQEEGRKDKDRILEDARRESDRLRRFAGQEIDFLADSAVRELKLQVAEEAVSLARKHIQKKMTADIQAVLIDRSIDKLEALYEESGAGKAVHPGSR